MISRDSAGRNCRFSTFSHSKPCGFRDATTNPSPRRDLFPFFIEKFIALLHSALRFAERIDWESLNTEFGAFYDDMVGGRRRRLPALGLLDLKHAASFSNEVLIERWGVV